MYFLSNDFVTFSPDVNSVQNCDSLRLSDSRVGAYSDVKCLARPLTSTNWFSAEPWQRMCGGVVDPSTGRYCNMYVPLREKKHHRQGPHLPAEPRLCQKLICDRQRLPRHGIDVIMLC